jgi:hypothetical protein
MHDTFSLYTTLGYLVALAVCFSRQKSSYDALALLLSINIQSDMGLHKEKNVKLKSMVYCVFRLYSSWQINYFTVSRMKS